MSTAPKSLGFGLGLRQPHYEEVLATRPPVDWFEILTENYLDAHPGYWQMLTDIRSHYPLVMHGVALNIAGVDPIDSAYLAKLKALASHVRPAYISDHLCWTSAQGIQSHDLLPVPYTEEALVHVANRVKQVQDALGIRLVLENPSTYLEFAASTMPEWEFLTRLAEEADCALLLDINNVYVSAFNHRYDAQRYLNALPQDRIAYVHLAGHRHQGSHIIDTHDTRVASEVWNLYADAVRRFGHLDTLIEWDGDIPTLATLLEERQKAIRITKAAAMKAAS